MTEDRITSGVEAAQEILSNVSGLNNNGEIVSQQTGLNEDVGETVLALVNLVEH